VPEARASALALQATGQETVQQPGRPFQSSMG